MFTEVIRKSEDDAFLWPLSNQGPLMLGRINSTEMERNTKLFSENVWYLHMIRSEEDLDTDQLWSTGYLLISPQDRAVLINVCVFLFIYFFWEFSQGHNKKLRTCSASLNVQWKKETCKYLYMVQGNTKPRKNKM